MLHRTVSAVAVLAIAIALSGRVEARPTPEQSAASRALYLRGLDAFNQGDYTLATRLWLDGYELDLRPLFLFNVGQAARMMGDKARAVEFFLKFVAAAPDAPERPQVDRLIQELSPPPVPAPSPPPAPLATPTPTTPPLPLPSVAVVGAGGARRVDSKPRDRTAIALAGAGAVSLAVGIGVAAWAGSKVSRSNTSYTAFADARNAQAPLAVGCVFAAVGVGLVAAGVARYIVVERRRKLSLAVAPAASGAVAQLGGAF